MYHKTKVVGSDLQECLDENCVNEYYTYTLDDPHGNNQFNLDWEFRGDLKQAYSAERISIEDEREIFMDSYDSGHAQGHAQVCVEYIERMEDWKNVNK